jgi:hypothetical protein
MYLRENPWSASRKKDRQAYEHDALQKGLIAVNSILRDWIKGQITAVECGILSFEAVFMPYVLLPDGRRLIEAVQQQGLLPPPSDGGGPA